MNILKIKPYLLIILIALISCQQKEEENGSIASTHPKLEKQLEKRSVKQPISNKENSDLYESYRITMAEYEQNDSYETAKMYRGRLAPVDDKSHSEANEYREALNKGMKQGINFAGMYTIVTVDCGSECQMHFVVNRENGKILDKLKSKTGAKFNKNSKLLILNPPDSTINYRHCQQCSPKAYVFEAEKFRQVESEPKR